jgi:hypothetical protein
MSRCSYLLGCSSTSLDLTFPLKCAKVPPGACFSHSTLRSIVSKRDYSALSCRTRSPRRTRPSRPCLFGAIGIRGAVGFLFEIQSHPHLSAISFARAVVAHQWLI